MEQQGSFHGVDKTEVKANKKQRAIPKTKINSKTTVQDR